MRRLGRPVRPGRLFRNLVVRPLCAPSFGGFWRLWNPPYCYVLLYYVYRPARRRLPHPAALYLTFLVSGLFLHDIPANLPDVARGRVPSLTGTALFAIFGAVAVASDWLGVDLSRRPAWVRGAANVALLIAGFSLRRLFVTH